MSEQLPTRRGGRWRQIAVNCNARRREVSRRAGSRRTPPPKQVTITAGKGQACVFENRFVPYGGIAIAKVTRGRTGTTGFQITPVANPARQYVQTATTTAENEPALARGDSTGRLRLGRYVIQETGTTPEGEGRWTLVEVNCAGRLRGFSQGQTTVTLTREHPRVRCRFVDSFTPDAPPLPVTPDPQPEPSPSGPAPDLVVTKRALQRRVNFGKIATFEITVRNAGPAAAQQVIVDDAPGVNAQLVSARTSRGACNERTPPDLPHRAAGPGRAGHDPRACARGRHPADQQPRRGRHRHARADARQQRRPRASARARAGRRARRLRGRGRARRLLTRGGAPPGSSCWDDERLWATGAPAGVGAP